MVRNTRSNKNTKNNKLNNKKVMVKEIKKVSDEEFIRGEESEIKTVEVFDYENVKVKYKVTNYKNNKRVVYVCGREIEAFIGLDNNAREAIKSGEKKVEIYDNYSTEDEKPLLYLIEVL